ncbi:aldose 1-epimerase family protein [Oscillospiraceae bacterium 50-60]
MRFTLSRGSLEAAVQTHGGELVSLRRGGTEYIWGGDPAFWSGQNPILFPIVGSLKNGRVDIGAQTCEMSRHGFARNLDFIPVEQDGFSVTLELRESGETLAHYPFPFSLRVRHRLLEDGFSTAFTVENTGGTPLPFCIGAHTAFRCPLLDGERFEDYHLVFNRRENAPTLLLTPEGLILGAAAEPMLCGGALSLNYEIFRRLDTVIFRQLQSDSVSLVHRKTGRGVKMDFSQFPMIAFWTKPGAPFLCLEPWQGCAAFDHETGRFQDKPFAVTLAPGETKTLAYSVTLLSGV